VLREAAVAITLLLSLVIYTMASPPSLGHPANPAVTPSHIRPEWYFFPSYRWLKMVPLQVGMWTTVAFVLAMIFWPWVDRALERLAPGRRLGTWVGIAGWLFTIVLLVWEAVS